MFFPYSHFVFKIIAILAFVTMASAQDWIDAHATFYGDPAGHETEEGACGYKVFSQGYGLQTTALSVTLYEDGAKCGSCYEIKCVNSQWCKPGVDTIKVTATNLCPSSSGPAAWCNPPNRHFDLSEPMFVAIAEYKAGIVPVQYKRISCNKQGGIKFQIKGNPNFLLVLVFNVGGAGDITGMRVKGSSGGDWAPMSRNWGMNWQIGGGPWPGIGLSFQVMVSSGQTLELDGVVPPNWQFDQTFEGHSNF